MSIRVPAAQAQASAITQNTHSDLVCHTYLNSSVNITAMPPCPAPACGELASARSPQVCVCPTEVPQREQGGGGVLRGHLSTPKSHQTPRSKDPHSWNCRSLAFLEHTPVARTANTVSHLVHPGGSCGQGTTCCPMTQHFQSWQSAAGDPEYQSSPPTVQEATEPGRRVPCAGASARGHHPPGARTGTHTEWRQHTVDRLPASDARQADLEPARLTAAAAGDEDNCIYTCCAL